VRVVSSRSGLATKAPDTPWLVTASRTSSTPIGSQFTGAAFTSALADRGVAISMDGKGAWRDNVFVERLWRSVKYGEVYLRCL
jgi:putative transposase